MQKDYKFSKHFEDRIKERKLQKDWILETIKNPDKIEEISEKEIHFLKKIVEFGERCLKVIANPINKVIITAFFDRKMTKNNCK